MSSNTNNDQHEVLEAMFTSADAAERYKLAENGTGPFAKILVERSGLAELDGDANILDFATGTGVVVKEIYDAVPKSKWDSLSVLGTDFSPVMVDYLKSRAEKEGWKGVQVSVIDGNKDFDLPEASYTHVFLSFGIFVMPGILPKLHSLLAPGGFIGVTTWATLPWQSLVTRSIAQMAEQPYCPTQAEMTAKLFQGRDWGNMSYVTTQLHDAGFVHTDSTRHQLRAECFNTAKEYMQTIQFPLQVIVTFWEEGKREAWLEELLAIMERELAKDVGGEDKPISSDFDGNVVWGRKES